MDIIRVLLVDDHTIVREGLRLLIDMQDDMQVVGEAANGEEAIALFAELRPHIALLDLMLPDMCGIDALKKIRQHNPDALVMILTTFEGEEDILRALQAGVRGYLLKDAPKAILFEAIRKIVRGEQFIPPEIALKVASYVGETSLTSREMEILSLVASGLSNRQIAHKMYITEGTVKTHVNHILAKLSAKSRTEAVRVAEARGLLRGFR